MNKLLAYCGLLLFSVPLRGQEVIRAGGDIFTNGTTRLEWTLGELMTETYAGVYVLTQGFHQPGLGEFPLVSTGEPIEVSTLDLYPNPAFGTVWVRTPQRVRALELVTAAGRSVDVRFRGGQGEYSADVTTLPAGLYLLRIYFVDSQPLVRRLVVNR
ncbi:MAG: T9SS type A sorting domain-containing protein [Bacteroidota bacterium]